MALIKILISGQKGKLDQGKCFLDDFLSDIIQVNLRKFDIFTSNTHRQDF